MSIEQWTSVDRYVEAALLEPDPVLEAALEASAAAGLPPIQVSASQGKFLHLLARIRGASSILELGTLGAYSTIWLARALPPGGRLITLELDPKHASVAKENLRRAELTDRVEVQVGKALESSFGLVSKTAFTLERTETRMEFAVIGRRSNKAIQAKFLLQALNRGGEMFIIIPQSVLNPLRPSLAKVLTGETSTRRDPRWTSQIAAEVQKTTVHLRAVLEERHLSLGEIAGLKVGQVIALDATPATRIKLEGNDKPLFWCHAGQSQGAYVLRIDEAIQDKEGADHGLAG